MQAVYLRHVNDGHNKHYFIWLTKTGADIDVMVGWGKIGATPTAQKAETHKSLADAEKAVNNIVKARLQRGYNRVWFNAIGDREPLDDWGIYGARNRLDGMPCPAGFPGVHLVGMSPIPTEPRKPRSMSVEPPAPMIRDDAEWNF